MPHPSKPNNLTDVLDKINKNLEQINVKLGKILQSTKTLQKTPREEPKELQALDVMTLLSLPDHLRKTAMVLSRLGRATASHVSTESRRARAVESGYLNQLVVMGHVKKMREGRDVYFYIE